MVSVVVAARGIQGTPRTLGHEYRYGRSLSIPYTAETGSFTAHLVRTVSVAECRQRVPRLLDICDIPGQQNTKTIRRSIQSLLLAKLPDFVEDPSRRTDTSFHRV